MRDNSGVKLSRIRTPDFDLAKTLGSGQVFHWQPHEGGFAGTIGDAAAFVEQRGDSVLFSGVPPKKVRNYFALDHPLAEICRSFPNDEAMRAAAQFCRGLRIIRQPKWECLATFICSSMKQVAHIRQMSLALRKRFGGTARIAGAEVRTFPPADRIASATEQALRECALGYRAKNLLLTARAVANGDANLETWSDLPDAELRARLCELPGVGAKVANCVMLFAYDRLRAFPIDVWIERVVKEKYFPLCRKVTSARLREFCSEYFGEHGGYAQQYLFHLARTTTPRRRRLLGGPSRSIVRRKRQQ